MFQNSGGLAANIGVVPSVVRLMKLTGADLCCFCRVSDLLHVPLSEYASATTKTPADKSTVQSITSLTNSFFLEPTGSTFQGPVRLCMSYTANYKKYTKYTFKELIGSCGVAQVCGQ